MTIAQAAKAIYEADHLTLACHVGPDGDALGSMLGLGTAAKRAGKDVVASFGSPFIVPKNLSFLPTDLLVAPDEVPESPGTMVVFDAGSADRLAELASAAKAADKVVVLDHHVTNEGFGDVSVVDSDAAATGELVIRVLDHLQWPIDEVIATCLLTAIITDTGRFQYASTRPATLMAAARLVEAGARPEEISRHVYEEAPFGYLKAAGRALMRAELDEELSLVTTFVTQEDLDENEIDWGDIDNLINTVRLAEEADSVAIAKVHEDGRVKVSMRSRGGTDVGALAADLGGGGHRLASGFTVERAVEDVLAEIRDRIAQYR